MSNKKLTLGIKSWLASLVLSGAAALSAKEASAETHPQVGVDLVKTVVRSDRTAQIDYSNHLFGEELASTDNLDIVSQYYVWNLFEADEKGVIPGLLTDGSVSVSKEKSNNMAKDGIQNNVSKKTTASRVYLHEPTGTAFLGLDYHDVSMDMGSERSASTLSDHMLLRIHDQSELRKVQDWLVASINKIGQKNEATEALFSLFKATQSPLFQNLPQGNVKPYHLSSSQMKSVEATFVRTGHFSLLPDGLTMREGRSLD